MEENLAPKNNLRLFILVSILALSLILAFGYFFLYKKPDVVPQNIQAQNTNTPTTTKQFADWKTYKNDEYGFEVQYPKNYSVSESRSGVDIFNNENQSAHFSIVVYTNHNNDSVLDYVKKLADQKPSNKNPSVLHFYTFSSTTINRMEAVNAKVGAEGCGNIKEVYLRIKGSIVRYYYCEDIDYIFNNESDFQSYLKDGEQILSTFKLVEPSIINIPQGDEVGYVKRVYRSNGKYYIDFDEIQFFLGAGVNEAMIQDGNCKSSIDGIQCFNPSGYYIRNKDTGIKSVEIANNAQAVVLSDCYTLTNSGIPITVDKFVSNFGLGTACLAPGAADFYVPTGSPYWIKLNSDGKIEKITEQYIP